MKTPKIELEARITALQEGLRQQNIDGALITHRMDCLYYTGTAQDTVVYVPVAGAPLLMVKRDIERAQNESPYPSIVLGGISAIPQYIAKAGLPIPELLGLEFDVLNVNIFQRYDKAFASSKKADVSMMVRMQRAVKSAWELERLEECAKIFPQLMDYAAKILRPGMSEIELCGELFLRSTMLGNHGTVHVRTAAGDSGVGGVVSGPRACQGGCFPGPVVGIGPSIASPLGPSYGLIQPGEPILIDLLMVVDGYTCDQTRTLCIGELAPEMQQAHKTTVEILEKVRVLAVPGAKTGDIYAEIVSWVNNNTPYEENFMGYRHTRVPFIGHGVGLELDELPTLSRGAQDVLVPGMVLAVEPKLVFPSGAVGVEDMLVIEGSTGARILTHGSSDIIYV